MDRTLNVYAKTGHLFAEFQFHYDQPQQATGHYTEYRRLYTDEEEDEFKTVIPLVKMDVYLTFRQFGSIDEIKAHDREVIRREMGHSMEGRPDEYVYTYDSEPVLQRYVAANPLGCIGIVNVRYSFAGNTKEVEFISGTNPRYDATLSADSLETNISCILRLPIHLNEEITGISSHDLTRLLPMY